MSMTDVEAGTYEVKTNHFTAQFVDDVLILLYYIFFSCYDVYPIFR